jgi:hypothetical protein
MEPDRPGHWINLLIHAPLQVDDPVGPEIRYPQARHCIKGDELVAWRHVKDPRRPTIIPVRDPATPMAKWKVFTALAFV